jgi:hypothetical protein
MLPFKKGTLITTFVFSLNIFFVFFQVNFFFVSLSCSDVQVKQLIMFLNDEFDGRIVLKDLVMNVQRCFISDLGQ